MTSKRPDPHHPQPAIVHPGSETAEARPGGRDDVDTAPLRAPRELPATVRGPDWEDPSRSDLEAAQGLLGGLPREQRPWLVDRGRLARGGMGHISRVLDRRLRRHVALKVLNATIADGATARRRFLEEAQITAQLDHPNIPAVHDLWLDDKGNPCFTMKLVQGLTLGRLLEAHSPKERSHDELEQLLKTFVKVCDAVSFAHSRGVIHRDLKPENIMVGSHGQVYVMDWGCALLIAGVRPADGAAVAVDRDPSCEALDLPGSVIGTYDYMAPEQAQALSAQIDEQTDVYLLGGILYEILTGRTPHRGVSHVDTLRRATEGEVDDPQAVADGARLPPALCSIAMRALQRRPADRYESVQALKQAVEQALKSGWWLSPVDFPAGEVIVREGDVADAAYIITRGSCAVYRTANGTRVPLRTMGPWEVFGETAIFTSRQRTASVETLEETSAIVVTREALERELSAPWVFAFVRALAERFLELEAEVSAHRKDRSADGSPATR